MRIDATTYRDLSILTANGEESAFQRLDHTRTDPGRQCLERMFREPLASTDGITGMQRVLSAVMARTEEWPKRVSNGTLLVMEKFCDYPLDPMPARADPVGSHIYRLVHMPDFSMARFSLSHFQDFITDMDAILRLFRDGEDIPQPLSAWVQRVEKCLDRQPLKELMQRPLGKPFSVVETVRYGNLFHRDLRHLTAELIGLYARMDAWYSMASAMHRFKLVFPEVTDRPEPLIEAEGLFHILLREPVPYDVTMDPETNFMFLTGANMAGKSTFIKAVGLAVFLAHVGMGVPANSMRLSLFDGILSNIQVTDNLSRGESYFFNEVQRIRHTIETIDNGRRWLVLIDELFKGTNIQDAMRCSLTVIKGLSRIRSVLYILSTHLYEIGEELKAYPNIGFRYLETSIEEDRIAFSFRLKEGISNDRLGYLIMKREGVVDLLDRL